MTVARVLRGSVAASAVTVSVTGEAASGGWTPPVAPSYPAATAHGADQHPAYQLIGGDAGLGLVSGFGTDAFYMIEHDAGGNAVIEPGPETRVFYFTNGGNGWTKAQIAVAESVSEGTITDAWLIAQDVYGASEADALNFADWSYSPVGVWAAANYQKSPWILHERGESYTDYGGFFSLSAHSGECPLHPTVLGAWGIGDEPVMQGIAWGEGGGGPHDRHSIVFNGVTFADTVGTAENGMRDVMWTNCVITTDDYGMTIEGSAMERITLMETRIEDCIKSVPADGSLPWDSAHDDRSSGAYIDQVNHLLIMNMWMDHNAWGDDYNTNLDISALNDGGQHPSQFSHNLYNSVFCSNTTARAVVTVRAAGSGIQLRSGHHSYENIYSEDNFAYQITGGVDPSNDVYTFQHGGIIAGGGIKQSYAAEIGFGGGNYAQGWAITGANQDDAVLYKNIVCNLADPNNASEVSAKSGVAGLSENIVDNHYNDTILFDWGSVTETNASGIGSTERDASTLGRWLDDRQAVSAGTNTTEDALDWLKAQAKPWQYAAEIQNYFFDQAGLDLSDRSVAASISFTPWIEGEGWRWDNPENWSSRDRPGVKVANDNVNLAGWTVTTYEPRCILNELTGAASTLYVHGGKTTCQTWGGTGTVYVQGAGQFWAGAATAGSKLVDVDAGRFGVSGDIDDDVSVAVRGRGEVLVLSGNTLTIGDGHTLTIEGASAKVGFDGDDAGAASIEIASGGTLAFDVDGDSAFSIIDVFRSGFYGLDANGQPNEPSVTGSVVLASGATVTVDTTGLGSGTYILAENVTDNGATLPAGVTVNGSSQLQVVVA